MIDIDKLKSRQKWGDRLVKLSTWVLPFVGALLSVSSDISAKEYPTTNTLIKELQDHAIWGFVAFFALVSIGKAMQRPGNATSWKAMQMHLDAMQKLACCEQDGDINDNHRVTLFKHKKWCWRKFKSSPITWIQLIKSGQLPGSGWLVPVLRSGQTSKKTKTVFWAPDDGRNAEGIAGYCWASDGVELAENLPSLSLSSNDRNKTKYAERTRMSEELVTEYLTRRRPLPRTLLGLPLKTSAYKTWGVIVIDSSVNGGINFEAADQAFRAIAAPVGVLLEDL